MMRIPIQILICSTLALSFSSCKDQTIYQSVLWIQNSSDITCEIVLFPKPEYKHGNMYLTSDVGKGYNYSSFEMASNSKEDIFISGNPDYQPNNLVSQVFDSIHIKSLNQDSFIIEFSLGKVSGYPVNIFTDSSAWKFMYRTFPIHTSFSKTEVESYEYTFDFSNQGL